MARAIIFSNGLISDLESARQLLRSDDFLLAVDGGTHHVLSLGLIPSVVIGDFDSLTEDDRKRLVHVGTRFLKYAQDKNETDLELALRYVLEAGYNCIVILGALGGRLDHTVSNLALLTNPEFADTNIRIDDGLEESFIVSSRTEIQGRCGDLVSLIPWGVTAEGVTTKGLKWPLNGETLYPHKTRGISNELLGASATIQVKSGFLLVIHRRK